MKTWQRMIIMLVTAIVLPTSAVGQYRIDWYSIDGGGGTSAAGPYTLLGAVGQPDAAYSAAGNYELLGGFLPGGPMCMVKFNDFARFAEQWLHTGSNLAGDIDRDQDVDIDDLSWLADFWLQYCPTPWQLK